MRQKAGDVRCVKGEVQNQARIKPESSTARGGGKIRPRRPSSSSPSMRARTVAAAVLRWLGVRDKGGEGLI